MQCMHVSMYVYCGYGADWLTRLWTGPSGEAQFVGQWSRPDFRSTQTADQPSGHQIWHKENSRILVWFESPVMWIPSLSISDFQWKFIMFESPAYNCRMFINIGDFNRQHWPCLPQVLPLGPATLHADSGALALLLGWHGAHWIQRSCRKWPKWFSTICHSHLVGAWATPLKNMKVSWDDEILNRHGKIRNVPNHQPAIWNYPNESS